MGTADLRGRDRLAGRLRRFLGRGRLRHRSRIRKRFVGNRYVGDVVDDRGRLIDRRRGWGWRRRRRGWRRNIGGRRRRRRWWRRNLSRRRRRRLGFGRRFGRGLESRAAMNAKLRTIGTCAATRVTIHLPPRSSTALCQKRTLANYLFQSGDDE
jgi:hypothetical protein